MDHKDVLELISASLDGELTAQQEAQLQAHLDQCGKCRALREELLGLREGCGELEVPPPPALKEQIMAALPAQELKTAGKKRSRWMSWTAMAAALVLIAVAAWRLPQFQGDQGKATDTTADRSDVAEAAGEAAPYAGAGEVVTGGVPDYVEDDWVDVNAVPMPRARDGGESIQLTSASATYEAAAVPGDLSGDVQENTAADAPAPAEQNGLSDQPRSKSSGSAAGGGAASQENKDQGMPELGAPETPTPFVVRSFIPDPVYCVDDSDTDVIPEILPLDDEPIENASPAAEASCIPVETFPAE